MQSFSSSLIKKFFFLGIIIPLFFSVALFGADPIRIMPLGDSITYDKWGSSDTRVEEDRIAYRGPLWTKLMNGGYSFDFVGSVTAGENYNPLFDPDNEGHSGWRADEIASQVFGYLENNAADIILLHIGTNDLYQGYDINTSVDRVEDILNNIDNYENVNTTHVKVILALIINRKPFHLDTEDFNIKVKAMVEQRIANGDDIVIVDMEHDAGFVYDDTDMFNELHPNDLGYEKIADLWYSALVPALESSTPIHLWKLDEANGPTYLDSYSGADGNCTEPGCPTAVPAGKIDGAQYIKRGNRVDVIDVANFNWAMDESFTIEFWVKSDYNQDSYNMAAIGRDGPADQETTHDYWWVGILMADPDENKRGYARFTLRDKEGNGTTVIHDIKVNDGVWHHIAAVRDGINNKNILYADGGSPKSVSWTYTADFDYKNESVNIGYLNLIPTIQDYYDGELDEMAVYNSALSAEEIKQHYENGDSAALKITSVPVTLAQINIPYLYDVDSNNPLTTFTLSVAPAWMQINETSGEITGMPNVVGNVDVTVNAVKGSETDTQSYVLQVRDTSTLPDGMDHYWKLNEANGSTYLDSSSGADGNCTLPDSCPLAIGGVKLMVLRVLTAVSTCLMY